MLELPVTTARTRKIPAVVLNQFDGFANFHFE